jgi:hypothetical protein
LEHFIGDGRVVTADGVDSNEVPQSWVDQIRSMILKPHSDRSDWRVTGSDQKLHQEQNHNIDCRVDLDRLVDQLSLSQSLVRSTFAIVNLLSSFLIQRPVIGGDEVVEVEQVEDQIEHVHHIHSASHRVVEKVGDDHHDRNVQDEVQNFVNSVVRFWESAGHFVVANLRNILSFLDIVVQNRVDKAQEGESNQNNPLIPDWLNR